MTSTPAGKRPAITTSEFDRFSDDPGFDLLEPLDDFSDPDFDEIVGTAHRVAAGESFD